MSTQETLLDLAIRHRWNTFPVPLQSALLALCADHGTTDVFGRGDLEYHCDDYGVEMETFFHYMADVIVSTSKNEKGIAQYHLLSQFMQFIRAKQPASAEK